MMRNRLRLSLLLLVWGASSASASPILDFTGGNEGISGTSTRGWAFSVTDPIVVSALGAWDEGADGLGDSHTVYLWTDAGALLATATVNNSSTPVASASSDGDWRFTNIAPLTLGAGTYVLGETFTGFSSPDATREGFFDPISVSTIPGVTYLELRFILAADTFPSSSSTLIGQFGPDLLGESAPTTVPEPATLGLLAIGLCALANRFRRRDISPTSQRPTGVANR